jgi:prepilin-type N-terminal cleavage/methylation domain-containing protein
MKQPRRRIRYSGFTLIELMISVVIGLLILLALITLLVNVSRNNSEMSKTNQIIENGRFALQLLQADISHAGYWGGYVPQFDDLSLGTTAVPNDVPTAVPNPCLAYTDWLIAPNIICFKFNRNCRSELRNSCRSAFTYAICLRKPGYQSQGQYRCACCSACRELCAGRWQLPRL